MSNAREIADLGTVFDSSGGMNLDSNTLVVDADSNRVGIGTDSPITPLHVEGTGQQRIRITSTDGDEATLNLGDGTSNFSIGIDGADSSSFKIADGTSIQTNARLTIDSNGRVLIGDSSTISSPDRKLQITGTTADNSSMSLARFTNSANASQITFIKSRAGGNGSNTVVSDGDTIGLLQFHADDGSDYDSVAGLIVVSVDGTPGTNDTPGRIEFRTTADGAASATERMRIDSSGNVGIGTTSPDSMLHIETVSGTAQIKLRKTVSGTSIIKVEDSGFLNINNTSAAGILFGTSNTEAMRIDSNRAVIFGKTSTDDTVGGAHFKNVAVNDSTPFNFTQTNGGGAGWVVMFNRQSSDGDLIKFRQANNDEGSISVSGSTVSYNGGHLARWSRLADDSKDTSIVKGTVMTNLDEMVVWSHDAVEAVEAQDAVYDDDGNVVTEAVEAVEAQDAYTEDNEQLNKMAVSSVEGDANVAGVFVNWDESDDFNDMNVAMTGDMIIRIASGTTVARGDLLMSAGDGTAKPQGDDIVRSKTIAKVTSTHVSHTYDDGSYLVPCVLMAC